MNITGVLAAMPITGQLQKNAIMPPARHESKVEWQGNCMKKTFCHEKHEKHEKIKNLANPSVKNVFTPKFLEFFRAFRLFRVFRGKNFNGF